MKRPLLAVCVFSLLVTSCSGDSGVDPIGGAPLSGTMTAVIDGSPWSATSDLRGLIHLGAAGFTGTDGQGRTISIGVTVTEGTGTFTVGQPLGPNSTLAFGPNVWVAGSGTGSGSVTLSTVTGTRLVGTFQFEWVATAEGQTPETRSVTGGTFDLTF
jgi:hypothetical protein